jgi:glycerol-3-phosphate dehydrogenase (NAD(P)+)
MGNNIGSKEDFQPNIRDILAISQFDTDFLKTNSVENLKPSVNKDDSSLSQVVGPSVATRPEIKVFTNEKQTTDFGKKIVVIGAGSYGTAIAKVLGNNGIDVALWARNKETVTDINEHRVPTKILSNNNLPDKIWATDNLEHALQDRGIIILATPSYTLEDIANRIKPHPESIVINLAKGFVFEGGNPFIKAGDYQRGPERGTKVTLPTLLLENLPHWDGFNRIVSLSGPGFAKNILNGSHFSLVAAARDLELAKQARNLLHGSQAKVFASSDIFTIQIAGAMKNVVAIGTGMNAGLGNGNLAGKFGEEGNAMLISRGLNEMLNIATRFASLHGCKAKHRTLNGVAGVGDLVLTSTSRESRNFRMGEELGKGTPVVEAINRLNLTAEGLVSAWGAKLLADQLSREDGKKLYAPISNTIVDVMQGHASPKRLFEILFQDLQSYHDGDPSDENGAIYI